MGHSHDHGLGLSLLIYLAAIAAAFLLLVVTPLYLFHGPTVYENHATTFRAIAAARERDFPLARLENKDIVDPAVVKALNAKARKAEKSARSHQRRRRAYTHRRRRQVRTVQQPANRNFWPFALFRTR